MEGGDNWKKYGTFSYLTVQLGQILGQCGLRPTNRGD